MIEAGLRSQIPKPRPVIDDIVGPALSEIKSWRGTTLGGNAMVKVRQRPGAILRRQSLDAVALVSAGRIGAHRNEVRLRRGAVRRRHHPYRRRGHPRLHQLLECPCHYSIYDPKEGPTVVSGPAPRPGRSKATRCRRSSITGSCLLRPRAIRCWRLTPKGDPLWRFKRPIPDDMLFLHPTSRGVGLLGDKVYFAAADAVLAALDAQTGKEVSQARSRTTPTDIICPWRRSLRTAK